MPNSPWHIRERDNADFSFSVQEAVNDFLASTEVKTLASTTQAEYTHVLGTFGAWCHTNALIQTSHSHWLAVDVDSEHSPIMLHQVNDHAVHLFLEHVKATHIPSKSGATKISSHTLANYAKGIKRFLNWCLLDEEYTEQVKVTTVMRIKKPRIEETILETFSSDQIAALKKACLKEESEHLRLRDEAILAMLLDTGIRASELITLTIGHVHLEPQDAHIRVFGKGSKWGEVGLGEESRRVLQRYVRRFREPTIEHVLNQDERYKKLPLRSQQLRKRQAVQQARLFVNRAGKPLTKSGLGQLIARLGEWAGIEGVRCSPHTFRHTFAKMFMQNGGDIYKLSRLLRHTSVKVTENYLKSLQQAEARKGAKSVLDNL